MTPKKVYIIFGAAVLIFGAALTYYLITKHPDGVRVGDDDLVYVFSFAAAHFIWNDAGNDIIDIRWQIEEPKLEIRKWLYENNYEYLTFLADTTMGEKGVMGGTDENPVYFGEIIYRR